MADITKPILLDETGQEIKEVLLGIKSAVQSSVVGADGFSPVAQVIQTETGAIITITDKMGMTTATVNNGSKGDKGDKGESGADGKTPVKGVDYFTEADIQELVLAVLAALPNGDEVEY